MKFVAVDVETANPDLASICQLGVVIFEAGQVVEVWDTLIDPEDYFYFSNVGVHGITEKHVKGAPTFPHVAEKLGGLLTGQVVAHHGAFDRNALGKVAAKYGLPPVECRWLDTTRVARRTWTEFATSGYGLANLARSFGITFNHHAAHEDARVAGEILVRASEHAGLALPELVERHSGPQSYAAGNQSRKGDPDAPLAGETVVFTGALSLTRQQAAEMAAAAGCDVATGINKRTTLLVVGDRDARSLGGQEKSSKHRKAEECIAAGQAIRILVESDFLAMIEGPR